MARILVLSSFPPFPLASGDRKRLGGILRCLGATNEVVLLAPACTPGGELGAALTTAHSHDSSWQSLVELSALACRYLPYCNFDAPHALSELASACRAQLVHTRQGAGAFDAVVCFGHDTAAAVQALDLPPVRLVDQCLLPHILLERTAATCGWNLKARHYFSKNAIQQAENLRQVGQRFQYVLCSEVDRQHLRQLGDFDAHVVENFADEGLITDTLRRQMDDIVAQRASGPIVLLGPFASLANRDALNWFSTRIMPHLAGKLDGREVICIGDGAQGKYLKQATRAGLELSGWIDDLGLELSKAAVFAIPLRIGSGTKTRILDAGLLSLPVVTTTIGAEGLPLEHGKHLLIADREQDYAREILAVLKGAHPNLGQSLHDLVQGFFLESQTMAGYPLLLQKLISS